ncbi:hypothetical protein GOP47_0028659 [Adiantum capillus-veneris]|nr:hypothetical protein GOP47_0028659 [Adiantum capillus-veneris]
MHVPSWLCCKTTSALPRVILLLASLFIASSLLPLRRPVPAFFWFQSGRHLPSSPPPQPTSTSPLPSPSSITLKTSNGASAIYRNATWNAHLGQWLSRCHSDALALLVHEPIFNKTCPKDCNHRGMCNHGDGKCRCYHGYIGPSCKNMLNLECNLEPLKMWPYGPWVVSICPAHCDKTRSTCFCGSGTKYPDRPVAEACGFKLNGTMVDWAKPDWDIFTNVSTKEGWCNVDPIDWNNKHAKVKEQCECKYDCTAGRLCEIAIQCVCINQCSGNGFCKGGICQCKPGWYGIDCSMPSSLVDRALWPKWLASGQTPPDEGMESSVVGKGVLQSRTVGVQKKHPLIYIYDLPPEFNSHLLEGRHWKFHCVNRVYDWDNATIWTPQLYGAEIALYEGLLNSPHRTLNAEEADFFYVPVLGACLIARADETPYLSMKNFMGLRSYFTLDFYRRAYLHISQSYPYWNRTAGRDHIWFFSWDEGACFAPKEIWNSMMLVHWGNTNIKHNHSTTGYFGDNWDHIPISERGSHACFDPQKDLVLPAWKVPNPALITERFWERPRSRRKTLFYFNGNLGNAFQYGRPEQRYSLGLRQKLAEEFGSSPNKDGMLGRQTTKDVTVTNLRSNHYSEELASSKFCGVLPGDGWSGRMEDSILHGCIPVIIQDGIQLIYENVLNYSQFAVRIKEDEIPQLVKILRAINETELDMKLNAIQGLWQRFLYRDAILLEAQRQEEEFGKTSVWGKAFSTLQDDDVLSTVLQVLHYKLYNDAWRPQSPKQRTKRHSLPQDCEVR